jgi:4-amino-4-deoxy-L-arabinose transferase-like glycosyltransferase
MRELLASNRRYFLGLTLAAIALRLYFALYIPVVTGDSLVYADIAKNILSYHVYGVSGSEGLHPTLIRLPGFPLLLAAIFKLFGQDNWHAVMIINTIIDVATCFVVAEAARRMINPRAAKIAFAIAALCPFTANYVGTGLTETISIFLTSVTILFAVIGLEEKRLAPWIGCGFSLAFAILVRPDGGWLLGAVGLTMLIRMWTIPGERKFLFKAGVVVLAISLAPLIPWTIRNWRVFHVFQPLVTVHASDPGEWEPENWNKWTYSWLADYASMEDVIFNVSGEPININDIPNRAFDSPAEKEKVSQLIAEYNAHDYTLTPEIDAQFAPLAQSQMREHPIRYFLIMPAVRILDMWFRPRTEMLPLDTHWWQFSQDLHDSLWATGLMLLNLGLIYIALRGIFNGPPMRVITLLLLFLVIRSVLLTIAGVVEDRYTLECFPCLFILGGRYLATSRILGKTAFRSSKTAMRVSPVTGA